MIMLPLYILLSFLRFDYFGQVFEILLKFFDRKITHVSDPEGNVLERAVTVAHEVSPLAHRLADLGKRLARCVLNTGYGNGKVVGVAIQLAVLPCPVLSDLSHLAVTLVAVLNANNCQGVSDVCIKQTAFVKMCSLWNPHGSLWT